MSDPNDVLAHPDPDLESLPATVPEGWALADERAVIHLARAVRTGSVDLKILKHRRDLEVEAWDHLIAAAEAKREAWLLAIRDYLTRHPGKIQTPDFTVSLRTPPEKIVVDDTAQTIYRLSEGFGGACIKTVQQLVKSEFDDVFRADPKAFKDCAHVETPAPTVTIRARGE